MLKEERSEEEENVGVRSWSHFHHKELSCLIGGANTNPSTKKDECECGERVCVCVCVCVCVSYTQGGQPTFPVNYFDIFLFGFVSPRHDLQLFTSSVTQCLNDIYKVTFPASVVEFMYYVCNVVYSLFLRLFKINLPSKTTEK